jgi:cystathionine beta-lyase
LVGGERKNFSKDDPPLKPETALATSGRDTRAQMGFVNPPVVHGSTVLYPTAEAASSSTADMERRPHGRCRTR